MPSYKPITVMVLGLLLAGASLFGGDGQTQPSQQYLQDDVQYFPGFPPTIQESGPSCPDVRLKATSGQYSDVLGELIFTDVVSVQFIGPGHPANPDGSLGAVVAGDDGWQMRIYERYIVKEATDEDGTTLRTLHAYDEIGKIEQSIPPLNVKRK